ncbi:MAG: hypothetical protein RML49_07185, partial [Verrucomicrobiae bacterium]|nr:hypothetical protein [Verrucomicrobiae bacterium]
NELAEAQARTEARLNELAEAQARTEVRLNELAEAQARTEVRLNELAEAQARTDKSIGALTEALGANLEDLAIDIVPELLEKHWHMKISSSGPEEIKTNGHVYPFDFVIRGHVKGQPVTVLGEAKSNLTEKEVVRFLKIVDRVKKGIKGKVKALFFGFRALSAAREKIERSGAAMVFSRGVMIGKF